VARAWLARVRVRWRASGRRVRGGRGGGGRAAGMWAANSAPHAPRLAVLSARAHNSCACLPCSTRLRTSVCSRGRTPQHTPLRPHASKRALRPRTRARAHLCTTMFLWQYSTPLMICWKKRRASSSGSRPFSTMWSKSSPPGQHGGSMRVCASVCTCVGVQRALAGWRVPQGQFTATRVWCVSRRHDATRARGAGGSPPPRPQTHTPHSVYRHPDLSRHDLSRHDSPLTYSMTT
jgi:hypothetical protein